MRFSSDRNRAKPVSPPDPGAPARSACWETFPHGADVGVRGYGASVAQAFANAAIALTAAVTDPTLVRPLRPSQIVCAAPDLEILLVDWLNQLVARMAIDGLLFSRFDVEIEHGRLTATAWGEPVDAARHAPAVEVKGATLTQLLVTRDPDGRWRAQCVVDV